MELLKSLSWKSALDIAHNYALSVSGCRKVAVGSLILKDRGVLSIGANKGIPNLCHMRGCLRVEKYGDDSKSHRDPADCRAIHSEIDAICSAARSGTSLIDSTIIVTRYPCESCAKAIIAAGIKTVIYGGTANVSEQTREMFECFGVECVHIKDWREDLTDR